jgi:hypothetical protein
MVKLIAPEEKLRDYYIKGTNYEYIITVNEDWKITYGPVTPGKGSYGGYALRIYESDTKQRAIFTDVISFRDMSIPVKRKVKKVAGKSEFQSDEKGSKSSKETSLDTSWEDETIE